jgi:hypothetical protein
MIAPASVELWVDRMNRAIADVGAAFASLVPAFRRDWTISYRIQQTVVTTRRAMYLDHFGKLPGGCASVALERFRFQIDNCIFSQKSACFFRRSLLQR